MFELPGATAMALMQVHVVASPMTQPPVRSGVLISVQCGPVVAVSPARASSVRHSDAPPARMRWGLLGSRTNGAMKFEFDVQASTITYGGAFVQPCAFSAPQM